MPRFGDDKFTPIDFEPQCPHEHDTETLERSNAICSRVDLASSPGPKKSSGSELRPTDACSPAIRFPRVKTAGYKHVQERSSSLRLEQQVECVTLLINFRSHAAFG